MFPDEISQRYNIIEIEEKYYFFLIGLPSFPRMVKPIDKAPVKVSLVKVAVHAGRKVMMEVDEKYCADYWRSTGDFRPTAQASSNPLIKYNYFVLIKF